MTITQKKKALQAAIKEIRTELGSGEYPKAMMNSNQMAKCTATINCGRGTTKSWSVMKEVLDRKVFTKLMAKCGFAVTSELVTESGVQPRWQVRIYYKEEN